MPPDSFRIITKSLLPADRWCNSSYENQAYARALRLYRQDKGCYESWEMLLGTEEQVCTHTHIKTLSLSVFFISL